MESVTSKLSRRSVLQGLGVAAAAVAVGGESPAWAQPGPATAPQVDADFSFVHLTDMHVTARRKGDQGYRACVDSVNALADKPAFALVGGDMAFDGLYTDRAIFERDISLYRDITAKLAMPAHHSIGNHDVLGLSPRRKVPADDPEIGKTMIMKRLGMERSYYSFDHAGWHFAVLDSIFLVDTKDGPGYEARIGEEQLHWLARDLGKAGDRPKVVMTHIAAFWNGGQIAADPKALAMNPEMVLRDTADLRRVLERHKVSALLQGHSHTIENYRYNGVWYLTSPAVSAAWWGGTWKGAPPSYTLFRCKGDQLAWEYRAFDWTIQRDPEDTKEVELQAKYDAEAAEQQRLAAAERAG
jgi:3',5'-cyclic AMP phosphodiesterase CpdA